MSAASTTTASSSTDGLPALGGPAGGLLPSTTLLLALVPRSEGAEGDDGGAGVAHEDAMHDEPTDRGGVGFTEPTEDVTREERFARAG